MLTRERILAAAATTFREAGYGRANLDDIARAAAITKGALYFHFDSKASLAGALITEHDAAWDRRFTEVAGLDLPALEMLDWIIRDSARWYAHDETAQAGLRLGMEADEIGADVLVEAPFRVWTDRLTSLVRAGQQDGSITRNATAPGLARIVVGSYIGIHEMSARSRRREDISKRIDEWWRVLRGSIAA